MQDTPENRITLRSLLLGTLFAGLFAVLTVFFENHRRMLPTANQIPVFPYVLLFLTVLLINPVCRLIRVVRRFTSAEIMIVFVMGMVSSGISTFGLTAQIIPVMGSLMNRYWNNDQTEWNRYVEPFLNENYFVAEPGIQSAAREYRDALVAPRELRRVYDAAVAYQRLREQEGADDALPGKADGRTGTLPAWARILSEEGVPPVEDILRTYPALIDSREKEAAAKKAALRDLEKKAYARVEVFRRGLPRSQRAFPGFIPVAGEDDAAGYFRRLRRLVCGRRAARDLRQAAAVLEQEGQTQPLPLDVVEQLVGHLDSAATALEPTTSTERLERERGELTRHDEALARELSDIDAQLVVLNRQRRLTTIEEARELEKQIDVLHKQAKAREKQREELEVARERNQFQMEATERAAAAMARIRERRDALRDSEARNAADLLQEVHAILGTFPSFDASLHRYFLGDIPWSQWVTPLVHWALLIALTYVVLMTFNVLIFRQWAYHEKLIYPLAQLPGILAGNNDDQDGIIPQVFRSGLFWTGFAVSAGVLGWNVLCRSGALPGLRSLDLANSWYAYIRNSPLKGLLYGARSSVFFTMVGVAFLIPKKVSFSLWFFWVLYMAQLLLLVWTGHGQNESSFPSEWWYTLNFRTAEGGGALLVFASVVLFKCRKYFLCALSPASVRDLPRDEQLELRVSSFLFLSCSLGLILVLWRGMGVNVFYATFAYVIIMVITIGLVRAVTEGGIMGFQAKVGPFHLIRHLFGFDKSWAAPSLVAPLLVYYSILFLDIKTFIAPAMANSLKIRDDLKVSRAKFHLAIALCIVTASVTAVVTALMMCYSAGANSMHSWFYTTFPKSLFTRIAEMSKAPPAATASGRLWLGSGALLMAGLLYFRQRLFWLPHPIGLVMLVNPIMATYWFSIFLGWLANALVTKYGNKDTYTRARGLFIGLIAGELVMVTVAMMVSYILRRGLGIDLNR